MENVTPYLPSIGWILAFASLALTLFLGVILAFHWFRYAMNPAMTTVALIVYISVAGVLLSGMFASLLLFASL